MVKRLSVLMLVAGSLVAVNAKNGNISLNINFAKKKMWTYAIEYRSTCVFMQDSSMSEKKTGITCSLKGEVNEKADRISFAAGAISVISDLYDSKTQAQIAQKLSSVRYGIALVNGYPAVDSMIDLSAEGLPEWNLYLQFAKLFPDMPQQPIQKGYSWERHAVVSMKTARGSVPCDVYRLYKVDNISARKDTAYISWQFRFAATKQASDSSTVMKYVPVSGKGDGAAIIDIPNGFIIKATVNFETPIAQIGKVKVNWKETAVLTHQRENKGQN